MVDEMVAESIRMSIGQIIVFWNQLGYRFEGKVLGVSNDYLKYFDKHKEKERFVKLSEIREAELK